MKKYKITDIIEDEFGCEGRPEGEEPMVTILLVDDTGNSAASVWQISWLMKRNWISERKWSCRKKR